MRHVFLRLGLAALILAAFGESREAATAARARTFPIEISSNKPFVRVSVNGSAPQRFILDSGNRGASIVARECADRLGLERGAEESAEVGAGSGAKVGLTTARYPIVLSALGETLTVVTPVLLTLGHVAVLEGGRLDGLLGFDFLSRHVVEIDYERREIMIHDPTDYAPPAGAVVVPLDLETGWPIAEGTITTRGGVPIPCRLIVDTGVRFTIALFRPFSERNQLYDLPASLPRAVTGAGVGGLSRGDVVRLEELRLGSLSFPEPVAVISRDTNGLFTSDGPEGLIGGELLRRHRTTFDYAHRRMILEPYPAPSPAFEWDMSGLFLGTDAPAFKKIRVVAVNAETPAAELGLQPNDEIVSIDGRRTPDLTVGEAKDLFREPVDRKLEIRREGRLLRLTLKARRLV
jgi:hypothetical protein